MKMNDDNRDSSNHHSSSDDGSSGYSFAGRKAVDDQQQRKPQQQPKAKGRDPQILLTKKALALALSAPRAPPIGSAHRSLLVGQDPSCTRWTHHYHVRDHDNHQKRVEEELQEAHSRIPHTTLQQRLRQRLHRSHAYSHASSSSSPPGYSSVTRRRLPHPHLPAGPELGHQVTRFLGLILPLEWQHSSRDSGQARSIVDGIVTASAPLIALQKPSAVVGFLQLSRRVKRVAYGPHPRQYIDLLEPTEHQIRNGSNPNRNTTNSTSSSSPKDRRLIFFIHGGAWGSGHPWMYRLVAKSFLQQGYAVAILGYRVYPDEKSSARDQVEDCHLAAKYLQQYYPHYTKKVTVMGHSSGAHIALYWLVDRAKRQMKRHAAIKSNNTSAGTATSRNQDEPLHLDSLVGIAGPYDISHHFDYEAARGVEEFSPMKPVCGYTRQNFRIHSPALRLLDFLATFATSNNSAAQPAANVVAVQDYFPPMVLVHGVEDDTVPFTATAEAARVLRACGVTTCQELYNESVQHQEAVMQLMLGGVVLEEILDWIARLPTDGKSNFNSSSSSGEVSPAPPPIARSKL